MSEQYAQMEAAKEVIRMKKEYESGNALGPGYNVSDKGQGLKKGANDIRSSSGLDDSRYGANVSLTDALTNYAQDFGDLARASRQERPSSDGGNVINGGGFDSEGRRQEYQDFMRGSVDSMYANQEAQLGAALEQQIAGLEKAYADAIAEGKISVRDAERQFAEQKETIEKQAYMDSESINASAQHRGIQNSQQMIGLQQGANARTNAIHNANMSERDGRINDIKDRINAIKSKKDLDISSARAQHDYGLAGARAQADQAYMQGMGQFMGQDYFSDKEHGQNLEISDRNHGYNLDLEDVRNNNSLIQLGVQQKYNEKNAATQDRYNKENINIEFENRFKELSEQSRLRIAEMTVGHGFDMEKMAKSLQNDILMAGVQYGHSASLNAQQNRARANEIASSAMNAIEAEQRSYDLAVQRESAKYNPNTPEGKIFLNQKNAKIADIVATSQLEAEIGSIFLNPDKNYNGKPPTMYQSPKSLTGGDIFPSGFINKVTGKTSAQTKHEEAIERKLKAEKEEREFLKKYGL